MTVEIICVGTELLLGNIVNTNAAYLAEQCASLGLSCYYQSVVGDNEERLTEAIECAKKRSDVVILCGGLGPTEDDLTKEVVAKVCGLELVRDEHSKERIAYFFKQRNIQLTENNWKQAMMPQGAIVLDNDNGTAPGVIIEAENCRLILLPGPPNELIPLFEEKVNPYLSGLTSQVIVSKTVKLCGVSESLAETIIRDLIDNQTNPTIATYAKTGEVHIRVTASAQDEEQANGLIKPMVEELKARFKQDVYTTDEKVTLEKALVDMFVDNGLTITCAESCTGGMLSARIINVSGVSDVYKSGVVTYANKAKRKFLNVKKKTLIKYGAVSKQTAKEMAKGAARLAKADVAIAITGIAGPDGGTPEKPVGLVYIACYVKGKVAVKEYRFNGNRSKIRENATTYALTMARSCILDYLK